MRMLRHNEVYMASLKNEYAQNAFASTSGYMHTTSDNGTSVAEGIKHFLENPEDIEPSVMIDPRHDEAQIEQTIELFDRQISTLMSLATRTVEQEAHLDTLIAKSNELFRYEELLASMAGAALGDHNRHRSIAAELAIENMGGIKKPIFNSLLLELVEAAKKSQLHDVRELEKMIHLCADAEVATSEYELSDETMQVIKEVIIELFPKMAEVIDDAERAGEQRVPVTDAVDVFRSVQSTLGLVGWDVDTEDRKSARTVAKQHTTFIGRNREPFKSRLDAVAVGFHEAIHALRSEGGVLADSLVFEEGLATKLQQIISGVKRAPGKQYYLAIGLQAGIDRSEYRRSYRETFEIMWRRELMIMEQDGQKIDIGLARSNAQRQVHRTRRGGAIDTRDRSYFDGGQLASKWLNEIAGLPRDECRSQLLWAISAGFDPTNPKHVAIKSETA